MLLQKVSSTVTICWSCVRSPPLVLFMELQSTLRRALWDKVASCVKLSSSLSQFHLCWHRCTDVPCNRSQPLLLPSSAVTSHITLWTSAGRPHSNAYWDPVVAIQIGCFSRVLLFFNWWNSTDEQEVPCSQYWSEAEMSHAQKNNEGTRPGSVWMWSWVWSVRFVYCNCLPWAWAVCLQSLPWTSAHVSCRWPFGSPGCDVGDLQGSHLMPQVIQGRQLYLQRPWLQEQLLGTVWSRAAPGARDLYPGGEAGSA